MSKEESVIEGVSHVAIRNGDLTFFMDIENLVIVHDDGYSGLEDTWEFGEYDVMPSQPTFSINGKVVEDSDGIAYRIVYDQPKEPVQRSAEMKVETFDNSFIEAARTRCGAPEDAPYFRKWGPDGSTTVTFEWSE